MRYVIQARNNTGPNYWDSTRHGGDTLAQAKAAEKQLLANDSAWMSGERVTRIIDTQPGDMETALRDLTNAIDLRKLNVRKDYSLMVAHAQALKILAKGAT